MDTIHINSGGKNVHAESLSKHARLQKERQQTWSLHPALNYDGAMEPRTVAFFKFFYFLWCHLDVAGMKCSIQHPPTRTDGMPYRTNGHAGSTSGFGYAAHTHADT